MTTIELLQRHIRSFLAYDLEGILSDYAPDAVFFTPVATLRGREAIRGFFTALLAEFSKPGASFALGQQRVEADHAYILWTARTADNDYEYATDTFFIRNGKIEVQSFAGKVTPLSPLHAVPRRAGADDAAVLAATQA